MKNNQQFWSSVSMSSNGQHIIISEYNGNVYRSNDYANNWLKEDVSLDKWNVVNISKNALFLLAGAGTNDFPSITVKKSCELISSVEQISGLKSWVDANDQSSITI
jgi:hypothetical protein